MSKHVQTKVPESQYAETISLGEKIAYGGGDLASNLILVLTSTFATFFYTDALGLRSILRSCPIWKSASRKASCNLTSGGNKYGQNFPL